MSDSVLLAWDFPPVVCTTLALTAIVYTRGWIRIRRTRPAQFPPWRLFSFLAGIVSLVVAVASPLDTFSDQLLVMHMAQHYVLMSLAPPLVVLSAPVVPMLRGLPKWMVRNIVGPLLRLSALRALFHGLSRLRVAWLLMNISYLAWHVPAAYELALAHENIHEVEHGIFFFTSVIFWWPIIQPWPSHFTRNRWAILPYLVGSDVINTALSAFLCFADRVVYPSYAEQPRVFGISAMSDQAAAGALMWVLGSIAFLIPAMAITMQLLSPRRVQRRVRAVQS
ncbi:cytochrome c oxidase assembly protein [Silvibacterium acidisoli]|uniref:cytochrome c oxidase assembly protein n=1 Tax=Acidobacteriaceae bacterium ZG23-2 TaxID=2883246 RepID=UPI00406D45B4